MLVSSWACLGRRWAWHGAGVGLWPGTDTGLGSGLSTKTRTQPRAPMGGWGLEIRSRGDQACWSSSGVAGAKSVSILSASYSLEKNSDSDSFLIRICPHIHWRRIQVLAVF